MHHPEVQWKIYRFLLGWFETTNMLSVFLTHVLFLNVLFRPTVWTVLLPHLLLKEPDARSIATTVAKEKKVWFSPKNPLLWLWVSNSFKLCVLFHPTWVWTNANLDCCGRSWFRWPTLPFRPSRALQAPRLWKGHGRLRWNLQPVSNLGLFKVIFDFPLINHHFGMMWLIFHILSLANPVSKVIKTMWRQTTGRATSLSKVWCWQTRSTILSWNPNLSPFPLPCGQNIPMPNSKHLGCMWLLGQHSYDINDTGYRKILMLKDGTCFFSPRGQPFSLCWKHSHGRLMKTTFEKPNEVVSSKHAFLHPPLTSGMQIWHCTSCFTSCSSFLGTWLMSYLWEWVGNLSLAPLLGRCFSLCHASRECGWRVIQLSFLA